MENNLKNNLRKLRNYLELNQANFAKPLGITGSFVSAMERGRSNVSESVLELLELKYNANRNWLLKDEGEMFLKKESSDTPYIKEGDIKEGDSPELVELLTMTREILTSETDCAFSLSANIRSFYKSVQLQRRVSDHEERLRRLEGEKGASPGKIRKEDPPEQKEKFIKRRAM